MSAEISAVPAAARLRITETFLSLQGEADAVGWPTFFIRLTGCPLRCHYCDTAYAFHGGEWRTVARLIDEARESRARHVCVTGDERRHRHECGRRARRAGDRRQDAGLRRVAQEPRPRGARDSRHGPAEVRH